MRIEQNLLSVKAVGYKSGDSEFNKEQGDNSHYVAKKEGV